VWSIGTQSPEMAVVKQYYTTIEKQQCTQVYSYLDTGFAQVSLEGYSKAASALDRAEGKLTGYSVIAFSLGSNQGTTFTVHVAREHQSYDVHLRLSQQGNAWKVMSYDGIEKEVPNCS
jgi:hypothetical protein